MDLEREVRKELIGGLQDYFECLEEVWLEHALFRGQKIRADVVAIPKFNRSSDYCFAFEVKLKSKVKDAEDYSEAIRQASDYIYAKVSPEPRCVKMAGRRITSAFVFPSPRLLRT